MKVKQKVFIWLSALGSKECEFENDNVTEKDFCFLNINVVGQISVR